MNLANYLTLILIGFGIWLLFLTFAFYLVLRHYRRLVKGVKDFDLKKILDKLLDAASANSKNIIGLKKALEVVKEEGQGHIQRIGLVRFNPFQETGGDHSFSLAVLDGKSSGFVITALHTRERTRVYVKSLKQGQAESQLSTEETRAIKQAFKN